MLISAIRKVIFSTLLITLFSGITPVKAQMPEVFDEGTLQEQFDFLQQRTNIYNNFRAIREDMFRKISSNAMDSLNAAKSEIATLNTTLSERRNENQQLQQTLNNTISERDQAIAERDSFNLMGFLISKNLYSLILWSLIVALLVLLIVLYLSFIRANVVARNRKTEIYDLKDEFENYKKTSRERFEKQSIEHFNEVKRLRGI